MKFRPTPPAATWFLKHFGPKPESETVIGDLHEQYQSGRSRIWYWQQVLAIVLLQLYRRETLSLEYQAGVLLENAFPILLAVSVVTAIVVSPFWPFLIVGVGIGVLGGVLKNAYDEQHETLINPASVRHYDRPNPLLRIDSSKIPITGGIGAGLLILILFTGAAHDLPMFRWLALPGVGLGLLHFGVLHFWKRSHKPAQPLVMLSLKNDKR